MANKKSAIRLFRAINEEELERGPYRFAGKDIEKIQRLTSWSRNREFAENWASREKIASGKEGIILCMEADQSDIAFFPLDSPHYKAEEETVVVDYHLKSDKLKNIADID